LAFTVMLATCQADGDDVVRAVAEAVQRTTRTSDLVAHVGGGRFVVLLLGTNLQGARIAADRVEVSLESVATGAVSFGLASYAPDLETSTLLLDAAERALETAQAAGGGVEFG
jgi:diguanylate cyclase (GGDEF)-like protein